MLPNVSGGSGNGTNNQSHGPNYSSKQSCGKYRDEAVADIADKCNLQGWPPGSNVTSTRITTIIGGAFFHGAGDCRSAVYNPGRGAAATTPPSGRGRAHGLESRSGTRAGPSGAGAKRTPRE
uniref:(northern house mosquito) hypothetical protein n=1 Tax=Culex pipiens TaxID=7175 RepID=A0A8D8NCE7_CULPI